MSERNLLPGVWLDRKVRILRSGREEKLYTDIILLKIVRKLSH